MTKITPTIGRRNSGPTRPIVMLDDVEDFMTAKEARRFAARLLKAADDAERKYVEWSHRPKPAPVSGAKGGDE